MQQEVENTCEPRGALRPVCLYVCVFVCLPVCVSVCLSLHTILHHTTSSITSPSIVLLHTAHTKLHHTTRHHLTLNTSPFTPDLSHLSLHTYTFTSSPHTMLHHCTIPGQSIERYRCFHRRGRQTSRSICREPWRKGTKRMHQLGWCCRRTERKEEYYGMSEQTSHIKEIKW